MSDIFVSYKREDLTAVGRLVEALRAEGIGVWWDQDIAPNAAWEATIEQQLAVAKVVIVAWSPAAVASENVKAEARWARQQGRLLQVFVEACEPPLFFGERQGVDLKHWSGAASDAAFRGVLDAVRKGLESASTQDRADPPAVYAAADHRRPAADQALDRGHALRQPLGRPGAGLLRRWDGGGDRQRAVAHPVHLRRRQRLDPVVQGQQGGQRRRRSPDCSGVRWCGWRAASATPAAACASPSS